MNYLISTEAPASISFFLISSASSGLMFSLITLGALSTRPLASTRPKPVISRTALMTATFVPPMSVRVTVTSLGPAAAASSATAATATGVAAVTPNFSSIAFTNSLSYKMVASSK